MTETKKKIYLSGPITLLGVKRARANFMMEAARLRARGFDVLTPFDNGLEKDAPYEEHMKADIEMLRNCDVICMLPGWRKSEGARRERKAAEEMGKGIVEIKLV